MDNSSVKQVLNRSEAVIFDLDGTLITTSKLQFEAFRRVFEKFNVVFTMDDYLRLIPKGGDRLIESMLLDGVHGTDKQFVEKVYKMYIREKKGIYDEYDNLRYMGDLSSFIQPREGLFELLKVFSKKFDLAVATSTNVYFAKVSLQYLGISNYFRAVITRTDIERTKPDKDIYLLTMHRLGKSPDKCVSIEDSPKGIHSAKNAGLYCIAIESQKSKREEQNMADYHIKELKELLF